MRRIDPREAHIKPLPTPDADSQAYWDALKEGGTVEQCGWLRDRYGLSWQIIPNALMRYIGSSDRAAAARAMKAMMDMVKLDSETLRRAYEGTA